MSNELESDMLVYGSGRQLQCTREDGDQPHASGMASNPEHNEGAVMGSFIGVVSAKFCRDQKRPADRGS
jgi:hypothetical protein